MICYRQNVANEVIIEKFRDLRGEYEELLDAWSTKSWSGTLAYIVNQSMVHSVGGCVKSCIYGQVDFVIVNRLRE